MIQEIYQKIHLIVIFKIVEFLVFDNLILAEELFAKVLSVLS